MTHCVQVRVLGLVTLFVSMTTMVGLQAKSMLQVNENTTDVLRNIFEEDQKDRTGIDDASIARDAKRREQVHRLLSDGKIESGDDYYYAAMVFQHGQTPSDYLLAHVLAVTAVVKGSKRGVWLSAATLDRYLQSVKQPQIFGTQFGSNAPAKGPYTQSPYDKNMLADTIRVAWCVASSSAQVSILTDVNAGKEFKSTNTCPAQ